jgi:hypothetical protein
LADDDGLGVAEDGGDGEAAGALHIHEEGPGSGHKGLQLVLAGLRGRAGVEEVDSENLCFKLSAIGPVKRYPTFGFQPSNSIQDCPSIQPLRC